MGSTVGDFMTSPVLSVRSDMTEKQDDDNDDDDDDDDDSLSDKEKKPRIQQRKIVDEQRRRGPTVKAWMKQHIRTVEASLTMAEMEALLLESDIGCIPVVQDGSLYLVGMVTRTDLL